MLKRFTFGCKLRDENFRADWNKIKDPKTTRFTIWKGKKNKEKELRGTHRSVGHMIGKLSRMDYPGIELRPSVCHDGNMRRTANADCMLELLNGSCYPRPDCSNLEPVRTAPRPARNRSS